MLDLFTHWHAGLTSIVLLTILWLLYAYAIRFKPNRKIIYFILGLVVVILTSFSPLHVVGAQYLFSVHMICHVLLLLIAAPLFVWSIPADNRFEHTLRNWAEKSMRYPLVPWLFGVGMMWLWHLPFIFNGLFTMSSSHSHATHHDGIWMQVHLFSLLLAGILFCWPLIHPYAAYRLSPLKSILYLSSACVFCSLLGLLITFAPLGIYLPYLHVHDSYGYLSLIRNRYGISVAVDQQMAGLIMWVPCCFIYLSASMIILVKWLSEPHGVTAIKKNAFHTVN
jgi:putative membrane protein